MKLANIIRTAGSRGADRLRCGRHDGDVRPRRITYRRCETPMAVYKGCTAIDVYRGCYRVGGYLWDRVLTAPYVLCFRVPTTLPGY
jgi:hypothetical protein